MGELAAALLAVDRTHPTETAVIVARLDALTDGLSEAHEELHVLASARAWARRWKALARAQRNALEPWRQVQDLAELEADLAVTSLEVERSRAEVERLREQSNSWMRAEVAWQHWADGLLRRLGRQPEGGALGDGPARDAIGAEVERLRGALEEIAYYGGNWWDGEAQANVRHIARRAMADTREPKP